MCHPFSNSSNVYGAPSTRELCAGSSVAWWSLCPQSLIPGPPSGPRPQVIISSTLNLFLALSEPILVQVFCRRFQKVLKNRNYFHFLSYPHPHPPKKSWWESKCWDTGMKVDYSSSLWLSRYLHSSGLCSEVLDFSPGSENDLPRKLTASSSLKCWQYTSLIMKFQMVVIGSHPPSILLLLLLLSHFSRVQLCATP